MRNPPFTSYSMICISGQLHNPTYIVRMNSDPSLKQAILILLIGENLMKKVLCENLATRYTNTAYIDLSVPHNTIKRSAQDRPRLFDKLVASRLKLGHQMMFISGYPETSLEAQHLVATYRDISVFCFEGNHDRQIIDIKRVLGERCKIEMVLSGRKPRRFIENKLDARFQSRFIDHMLKAEPALA